MSASNWMKLKRKIEDSLPLKDPSTKRKRRELSNASKQDDVEVEVAQPEPAAPPVNLGDKRPPFCKIDWRDKCKYVGLDCEMVGIGSDGKQSALARCSLVDFDGNTIYDEFVRPPAFVTDFRTKWSGIRKHDLRHGHAISLQECQSAVAKLLKGKILVGHALSNDLDALLLSHPRRMIRDTARYKPLMRPHGKSRRKLRPRALKDLTAQFLKTQIQGGEHDSSEDARAAMYIYRMHREEWEQYLLRPRHALKPSGGPEENEEDDELSDDQDEDDGDDVEIEGVAEVTEGNGKSGKNVDVTPNRSMKVSARSSVPGTNQTRPMKKPAAKVKGLAALLADKKTDKFGSKMRSFADVDRDKAKQNNRKQ